jgi:hypothetical protein
VAVLQEEVPQTWRRMLDRNPYLQMGREERGRREDGQGGRLRRGNRRRGGRRERGVKGGGEEGRKKNRITSKRKRDCSN